MICLTYNTTLYICRSRLDSNNIVDLVLVFDDNTDLFPCLPDTRRHHDEIRPRLLLLRTPSPSTPIRLRTLHRFHLPSQHYSLLWHRSRTGWNLFSAREGREPATASRRYRSPSALWRSSTGTRSSASLVSLTATRRSTAAAEGEEQNRHCWEHRQRWREFSDDRGWRREIQLQLNGTRHNGIRVNRSRGNTKSASNRNNREILKMACIGKKDKYHSQPIKRSRGELQRAKMNVTCRSKFKQ